MDTSSQLGAGADFNYADWATKYRLSRNEMNALVMDYLITEGYKEAAEKFQEEASAVVEDLERMDPQTLEFRIQIRQSINEGRIRDAIEMVNDRYPELFDENRQLYFQLLLQEFIEMIRCGELEAALAFAQAQLAEQGETNQACLAEMERALALLAFDKPEQSPFKDLLDISQRSKVADVVNSALLKFQNRPSNTKLESLMKLVFWSQAELDRRNFVYPKLIDVPSGSIQAPKEKTL